MPASATKTQNTLPSPRKGSQDQPIQRSFSIVDKYSPAKSRQEKNVKGATIDPLLYSDFCNNLTAVKSMVLVGSHNEITEIRTVAADLGDG